MGEREQEWEREWELGSRATKKHGICKDTRRILSFVFFFTTHLYFYTGLATFSVSIAVFLFLHSPHVAVPFSHFSLYFFPGRTGSCLPHDDICPPSLGSRWQKVGGKGGVGILPTLPTLNSLSPGRQTDTETEVVWERREVSGLQPRRANSGCRQVHNLSTPLLNQLPIFVFPPPVPPLTLFLLPWLFFSLYEFALD
jgi:hypothetical protein